MQSTIDKEEIHKVISFYIQNNYSPIRSYIGVPEIIKIKQELNEIKPDKEIVDFGGGDGLAASLIGDYFNINIDNATHQDFKENPVYNKTIVGDITNLPDEINSSGIITCISVIEHIPNWQAVFSEVYRTLKPGGIFILTTPNKAFFKPKLANFPFFKFYFNKLNKNHFKLFTINEAKQTLEEHGFKDVEVTSIGGRRLGFYWMFMRPLELLLPKKFLKAFFFKFAKMNLNQFLYEGSDGTTIYIKATK